jgi:MATE family multidrug resistance protein
VLLVFFMPVSILWTQTETIFLTLQQDPEVCKNAQEYVIAYTPGMIIMALINSQQRFLNMMAVNTMPLVCTSVGTLLHVGMCYWLVTQKQLGIQGVGIASSVTNLFTLSLMCFFSARNEVARDAIKMPDRRASQDLSLYLSLGIPSAVLLCLEWWAFEVLTLIIGYIGVNQQATFVIIFQV